MIKYEAFHGKLIFPTETELGQSSFLILIKIILNTEDEVRGG